MYVYGKKNTENTAEIIQTEFMFIFFPKQPAQDYRNY